MVEIWSSSSSWETVFETKTEQGITQTECIVYKRGISGGFPFLASVLIIPISVCLRKFRGVTIEGITKLTQLFYMDDLKVYAKGEGAWKNGEGGRRN